MCEFSGDEGTDRRTKLHGTATALAAGFNTQESASHTRSVQFSREAGRVADAHEADRTRCQRLAGKKRDACDAAARLRNAQTL